MSAPTYYTYKDPYPATLNHPNAVQLESKEDWPRSYRFNPNYNPTQGIHPPAPVYNANQPAPQSWYYGQQQPQGGYYAGGQYYQWPAPAGTAYTSSPYYYYQPSTSTYSYPYNSYNAYQWSTPSRPSPYSYAQYYKNFATQYSGWNPYSYMQYLAPGGPTMMPMPMPGCPATMTAQAATAAATNAALAAMPQAPSYFVGGGPTDFAAQQAILAAQMAAMGMPKPPPTQLAPYKPADGQQFWCKETDGSWTLRTHTDIVMGEVSPGHWERHATSGYFYWVRS